MTTLHSRIQARFPEGLTGVFALGGTRTSYILQKNRDKPNPGVIEDFLEYAEYGFRGARKILTWYYTFGGQHALIPHLDIRRLVDDRGAKYTKEVIKASYLLIDKTFCDFYEHHNITPRFAGIQPLLDHPDSAWSELGLAYQSFMDKHPHVEGNRILIWEVAPIALETIANAPVPEIDESNPVARMEAYYRYYARTAYGVEMPRPHFYLGQARNGDIKPRATLPFTLYNGGDTLRMYLTPYPSLYLEHKSFEAILAGLLDSQHFHSSDYDYENMLTATQATQLHNHFMSLATEINIVGLPNEKRV